MAWTEHYSDSHLRRILNRTRRIAVVGVSIKEVRPSYYVARYLSLKKFEVFPVNPAYAGQTVFGRKVHASLSDIGEGVDMVDIFRRPEHVPEVVDEALEAFPELQTIWMQIGVVARGSGGKGAGARRRRDHEPVPEDRISAAVRGTAHGRVQHRDDFLETVSVVRGAAPSRRGRDSPG